MWGSPAQQARLVEENYFGIDYNAVYFNTLVAIYLWSKNVLFDLTKINVTFGFVHINSSYPLSTIMNACLVFSPSGSFSLVKLAYSEDF